MKKDNFDFQAFLIIVMFLYILHFIFSFNVINNKPKLPKQNKNHVIEIKQNHETNFFCNLSLNLIYDKNNFMDSVMASVTSSCRGPCQVNSAISAAFKSNYVKGVVYEENSVKFSDFDINWVFSYWPKSIVNGFELNFDYTQTKVLLGPNVLEGDNDNFPEMRSIFKDVYHIAPSEWVADSWRTRGWHKTIGFCPSPVNTDKWFPSEFKIKRNFGENATPYHEAKCILYVKRLGEAYECAHPDLYEKAKTWLNSLNIKCEEFFYDAYDNGKLYQVGRESDFALVIDGTETQGYALQSIMSMDVPIFLMINSVGQLNLVAPFFDKTFSGSFATKQTSNNDVFKMFLTKLTFFQSRRIMIESVSYNASIQCIIKLLCNLKHNK